MGVSVSASVVYGVPIGSEDDVSFPWSEYDELQSWWDEVSGIEAAVNHLSPFDEHGQWKVDGSQSNEAMASTYYDALYRQQALKPCPVDLEWAGFSEGPSFILRVQGVDDVTAQNRDPVHLDFLDLATASTTPAVGQAYEALTEFMERWKIEATKPLGWYLIWNYSI